MKNRTKKILSMLLAVIMLLSVMPMAYAATKEYPPDAEQLIELAYKYAAYGSSIYEPAGYLNEKFGDIIIPGGFFDGYSFVDEITYQMSNEYEYIKDAIPKAIETLQGVVNMIEEDIANGEVTVVFSPYNFFRFYGYYELCYGDSKVIDDLFEKVATSSPNLEMYGQMVSDAMDSAERAENYLDDILDGKITVTQNTQTEFDAIWKEALPICYIILDCIEGIHIYGEYISNGDATEEADGTKTATCDFCGETDTVIDEGSKLESDNDNCSCSCHKSGIMGFIWKILTFFYKIFGMNKTCICGVAHY